MKIHENDIVLEQVLAEYFERLDRGDAVDEARLLAENPECGVELKSFFDQQRNLRERVAQLTEVSAQNTLKVRCPHCHQPSEVAVDSTLNDLTCSACSGRFNFLDESAKNGSVPLSMMGRFVLLERLGMGAFGSVWKARDDELDRIVAVKIPRQAAMTTEEEEKFLREARAAAQLRHPSIVSVHEIGRDQSSVYIVTDFVHGLTLGDWLANQQLTPREAVEMCIQLADALHHAHENGVVHRDLKLANIIIDDDGRPHITDFGLARRDLGEVTVTVDGQVLGTPAYMSPEQAAGNAHTADRRSDVYSLGVILFQLLTGELPFRGNSHMIIHQVIHDDPPSPRKLNSGVKRDLETIVLKALQKSPERRYGSAFEFADDLRRYLSNKPITAKPTTRLEELVKWSQRHRSLVAATTISALLLTAVLITSIILINRSRLHALEALDSTSELLYVADMKAAFEAWNKGWSDQVQPLLQRHVPGKDDTDRRRFEWYFLDRMTRLPEPIVIAAHKGAANEIAIFPDRKRIASVGDDGQIRIWDTKGRQLQTFDTGNLPLYSVSVSPDGNTVAAGSDFIHLCDLRGTSSPRTIFQGGYNFDSLAFSPDGNHLAGGERYDRLSVISLSDTNISALGLAQLSAKQDVPVPFAAAVPLEILSGLQSVPCASRVDSLEYIPGKSQILVPDRREDKTTLLQVWNQDLSERVREFSLPSIARMTAARCSPDGKFIATAEGKHRVACILLAETGEVVAETSQVRDLIISLEYSPNGRMLAVACDNGVVELFKLERNRNKQLIVSPRRRAIHAHTGTVTSVKFLDTETLVTSGIDGLVKVWRLLESGIQPVAFPDKRVKSVALSPDGQLVARINHDHFKLCDPLGEVVAEERLKGYSRGLAWSKDGDRIAVACEAANEIAIYDRKGKLTQTIGHPGVPRFAAFSPDGRLIASVGEETFQLYDLDEGQTIDQHPVSEHGAVAAAFSPSGRHVVYCGAAEAIVYDVAERRIFNRVPFKAESHNIAISPDGSCFATGHEDSTIRLWSLKEGKLIAELGGHERRVTSVEFSTDGSTLLSTSNEDGTLRMWSLDHMQALGIAARVLPFGIRSDDPLYCDASITSDGRTLLFVSHSPGDRLRTLFIDLQIP